MRYRHSHLLRNRNLAKLFILTICVLGFVQFLITFMSLGKPILHFKHSYRNTSNTAPLIDESADPISFELDIEDDLCTIAYVSPVVKIQCLLQRIKMAAKTHNFIRANMIAFKSSLLMEDKRKGRTDHVIKVASSGADHRRKENMQENRDSKKAIRVPTNMSVFGQLVKTSSSLPECPKTSPNIEGSRVANTTVLELQELEELFSFLLKGGDYKPLECSPKQRTAILIPYRNRWRHLLILLLNLVPFLVRQQLSFTIFVIEMEEPTLFNRAMLLNIGIIEAMKRDRYTCFIFQDVDLIPLDDRSLYRCGSQPRHLAVSMNKFQYKLPYATYFGGVTALSYDQLLKINGCSNLYFGWGGEDDDLFYRVKFKGMRVERYPYQISRYDMILHKIDKGNDIRPVRYQVLKKAATRLSVDGLNTTRYRLDNLELKPLYTWIKVFINMTEVMMSAPAYERSLLMSSNSTG